MSNEGIVVRPATEAFIEIRQKEVWKLLCRFDLQTYF